MAHTREDGTVGNMSEQQRERQGGGGRARGRSGSGGRGNERARGSRGSGSGRSSAQERERVRQLRARGGEELVDLAELAPETMAVTRAARERWERVHGEGALEGLRETCEEILIQGHHTLDDRGYHALYTEGYRLVVAPEGDAIISYDTLHRERTLAEVRSGVPSRFRGKPLSRAALLETEDDFIDEIHVPRRVLETHGPDADWDEFVDEIRDAVAEALEEEQVVSEGNRHVLTSSEWIVTLRADGKLVKDLAPNLGESPEDAPGEALVEA